MWNKPSNSTKTRAYAKNQTVSNSTPEADIVMFTSFVSDAGRLELQEIVLENWSRFYPKVKCVLFVNFTERNLNPAFADLIKFSIQHNWSVFPILEVNSYGTPYLIPLFKSVLTKFKSTFYGFVNGDNIFDQSLIKTLYATKSYLPKFNNSVLLTGTRRTVQLNNYKRVKAPHWKLEDLALLAGNIRTISENERSLW